MSIEKPTAENLTAATLDRNRASTESQKVNGEQAPAQAHQSGSYGKVREGRENRAVRGVPRLRTAKL